MHFTSDGYSESVSKKKFFFILRWFNCYNDDNETDAKSIKVSLHPNLLGPVGNMGSYAQSDQVQFNSKSWLSENNLNTLVGVVFYHAEYLQGLQFLGANYVMVQGNYECKGMCCIC